MDSGVLGRLDPGSEGAKGAVADSEGRLSKWMPATLSPVACPGLGGSDPWSTASVTGAK